MRLTFLFAGLCCLIYTGLIRREKPVARRAIPKYIGAAFETAGQFAYIFAIADESHLAMSAPHHLLLLRRLCDLGAGSS